MRRRQWAPDPAPRQSLTQPLLLLTRPYAQSRRFAAECRAACPPHETLIAPMSEIVPTTFDSAAFSGVKALVLTSPNAVAALAGVPGLHGLPAWCVGPATAAAARAAGFVVHESGGDAAHLIIDLQRTRPAGPLIHAHGRHLARDLVAELARDGFDIRGVTVYEARAMAWPEGVIEALESARIVVAPLFSPRAASELSQRLQGMQPQGLRFVAISANCIARLSARLRACAVVAKAPNAAAMCQAVSEELSQGCRQP